MKEEDNEESKDLIQSGIDIAKDIFQIEPFRKFFQKLAGPAVEELGQFFADHVRSFRIKAQIKIITKAKKLLEEAKIEPSTVSLKTLIPILENGSLEEEESMVDRWAALLASAASPDGNKIVHPSYPEILKQLSPLDAKILDAIYDHVIFTPIPKEEWPSRGASGNTIKEVFTLSDREYELVIDSLYRLRLLAPPSTDLSFVDTPHNFQLNTKFIICITELGFSFVASCQPHH